MRFVEFDTRLNHLKVRINPESILFISEMEDHIESTRIIFASSREVEVLGSMEEVESILLA